jgi:hypothetical protein
MSTPRPGGERDGPRCGGRPPGRAATTATRTGSQGSGCLPSRAALALAMRERAVSDRVIFAVAGEDAARLAAEVQGWELAVGHLADHGLLGVEPEWAATVRRMSWRWLACG